MKNPDPNVVVLSRSEWDAVNRLAGVGEQEVGDGKLRRLRNTINRRNTKLHDELKLRREMEMLKVRSLKQQMVELRRHCSQGGYVYIRVPAEPNNVYSHRTMPYAVRVGQIRFTWPVGILDVLPRIFVQTRVIVEGKEYRYRQWLNPIQFYSDDKATVPYFRQ